MSDVPNASRRALFKHALATLRPLVAPASAGASAGALGDYTVVDRRELAGGGLGLFIAIPRDLSSGEMKRLGELLRARFLDQSNAVVEIFDDPEAARTVRAGSRVVGEERFGAALRHQRATYTKNARAGRESLNLYGADPETIEYA